MKKKYMDEGQIIVTCNFCSNIIMKYHTNDIAPEIYDHEAIIICSSCRNNTVGEWK